MKKYNGVPDDCKPRKPIQWKESYVKEDRYIACYSWCTEKFGDEYQCWHIHGNRWGSNKGLWKSYEKKGKINVFCFRDEKHRLECELKFG